MRDKIWFILLSDLVGAVMVGGALWMFPEAMPFFVALTWFHTVTVSNKVDAAKKLCDAREEES